MTVLGLGQSWGQKGAGGCHVLLCQLCQLCPPPTSTPPPVTKRPPSCPLCHHPGPTTWLEALGIYRVHSG